MYRLLDLFSGIGGFSLGLERSGGFQTVAFCEIDPYCRKVLRKHWPEVPVFKDVRMLCRRTGDNMPEDDDFVECSIHKGEDFGDCECIGTDQFLDTIGPIDAICGGFPCQDISVAGKGAGIEGERSGLWSEYARIIGELRPRYVIVENVSALLGRGLDRVLGDLASLGYDAEWHCIPASAIGAPHRRDRLWLVAYTNDTGRVEQRWLIPIQPQQFAAECGGWWSVEPDVGGGFDGFPYWLDRHVGRGLSHAESCRRTKVLRRVWSDHVSQALRRAAGGLERVQQAEVLFSFVRQYEAGVDETRLLMAGAEASEDFLRSLRERACLGSAPRRSGQQEQRASEHPDALQPMPRFLARDGEAYWADGGWEDATPRVAHGVPARAHRLRALGNAVVPQIPELIGRAILAAEKAA